MNAVFFDMDGTLIDSRADLATGVNVTRAELGLEPLPQETVIGFVGCGARYLLENAIPERKGYFDELWPQFSRNYQAHMLDETVLYPGVLETIEELHELGWKMGINTNKPNFATHGILEHFGLARYFGNAVIAGGDCVEMKPSAMPLIECAARMGGHSLSSKDWMVGDNWTDMKCGVNAGVKTMYCTFGFGHLKECSYTVKIDRFNELTQCLKGLE